MKIFLSILYISFFVILDTYAQPGGGGPGGGGDPGIPIGGIELLLLAGAALGVKKIAGNNKKI